MTRRSLLSGVSPALAAACSGCAPKRSGLRIELDQLGEDLAISGFGLTISDVHGHYLGLLEPPEIYSGVAAVTADAGCIAWIQIHHRPGALAHSINIAVADGHHPLRTVPYNWWSPTDLAVTSGASHIAIVAISLLPRATRQVLVVNGETGNLEHDLTEVARPITDEIERLEITADGTRLAIGSRESFVVADVLSQRQLLTRRGRFPVLAPDGSALAFVDDKHRLVVKNLLTGAETYPLKGYRTLGVGHWSPDGRLLIACAWVALSWGIPLVAVDTRSGGYLQFAKLYEGDLGNRCRWISWRLLRSLGPLRYAPTN